MELVEGETLAQRIQRAGPFCEKDALEVVTQVASALQAAEKFGLVHRDLKPANIMLTVGPNIDVKVIDFGLAKVIGSQEPVDRITYNDSSEHRLSPARNSFPESRSTNVPIIFLWEARFTIC